LWRRTSLSLGFLGLAGCQARPTLPATTVAPCIDLPAPRADAASYFEFEVQIPAGVPGGFPRHQRAPVTGEILVQFVVNTAGTPELTTFRVLKTTDDRLAAQARAVLATLRFSPAQIITGCPVRQLAQEVFEFR
jgi:hypothetical protein